MSDKTEVYRSPWCNGPNREYLICSVKFSDGTKKTVLQHREIMEKHIGRLLLRDEYVHHINGNTKDNEIENLQLMSSSEHSVLHAREPEMMEIVCPECGNKATIFAREYRHNQINNKKAGPFCGRSCAGKYGARIQNNIPFGGRIDKNGKRTHRKETPHGTVSGYDYFKCRCDLCREAHNKAAKRYRERKALADSSDN